MNQEGDLCWYHGKLSRDAAEQLLKIGELNHFYFCIGFVLAKLCLSNDVFIGNISCYYICEYVFVYATKMIE